MLCHAKIHHEHLLKIYRACCWNYYYFISALPGIINIVVDLQQKLYNNSEPEIVHIIWLEGE